MNLSFTPHFSSDTDILIGVINAYLWLDEQGEEFLGVAIRSAEYATVRGYIS